MVAGTREAAVLMEGSRQFEIHVRNNYQDLVMDGVGGLEWGLLTQ